jgi:tetratricopeptide (TPR) repeat protein
MRCIIVASLALVPFLAGAQDTPTSKELKARAYLDRGKAYKAINLCTDHLSGKTAEPRFYVLRAEGYNMIDDHSKAEQDARRALAAFPGSVDALHQLGWAEQGMARNDSAVAHLSAVVARKPSAEAWFHLALTHQQQHDDRAALADLDHMKAVGGGQVTARVFRMRGECLAQLGDTALSRVAFDSALALSPRDPVCWNSRGFYRFASFGEHARAVKDYDRAIKLNPNYSYAFNNRGWSLYKLGDTEKAVKDITLALRKKAANPYAYRNMGVIKLDQGDVQGGCTDLNIALGLGFTELFGNEVKDLVAQRCPAVPASATPAPKPATDAPKAPPSNAPGNAPTKRTNAP